MNDERNHPSADLDIAIIGMSCRFPGASSPRDFWRNLKEGVESISFFPSASTKGCDGVVHIGAAGLIDNIHNFDRELFGISAKDASLMDPQQRLFLQCAWEAFEDAGYNPLEHSVPVGVYAACGSSTYNPTHNAADSKGYRQLTSVEDLQMLMGNEPDFVASQVAYRLNLRGPALGIQTACSSALVTVHLGCTALLNGDCEMALAGAAWVRVPQAVEYEYQQNMIFSPDGHCRPFSAQSGGTVFGSGVGIVLLKPLADALRDNDRIYCTIKGSAINNDGSVKLGFSAPGLEGQRDVISRALCVSGVAPETIGYLEAHGTATALGDVVEVKALSDAWNAREQSYCALGSVKGNIGHLGWASGIAGLIKAALALRHGEIPPTLYCGEPNPDLRLEETPFFLNTSPVPFPSLGPLRRAAVSAFGLGGTNAHVVLEEAPPHIAPPRVETSSPVILPLSGATPGSLQDLMLRHTDFLSGAGSEALRNICFTAATGRAHLRERIAVVGDSAEKLTETLRIQLERYKSLLPTQEVASPRVAFLFSGQGAQYPRMGRTLQKSEPVFKDAFEECRVILERDHKIDLTRLTSSDDPVEGALAFPVLLSLQYALFRLWSTWGIRPDYVLGFSAGEYAAACASGVMSLEAALHLAVVRGRLLTQSAIVTGSMVSIAESESFVTELISNRPELSIASASGPLSTVIAGPTSEIDEFCSSLDGRTSFTRLNTGAAGHCSLVDPILPTLEAEVNAIDLCPPLITFISSTDGLVKREEVTRATYWRDQTRLPVRFTRGLDTLIAGGVNVFVEIGPGPQLLSMAASYLPDRSIALIPSMNAARGSQQEAHVFMEGLARMYERGGSICWNTGLLGRGIKTSVPLYPFQPTVCSESEESGLECDRPVQRAELEKMLYEVEWQSTPATLPSSRSLTKVLACFPSFEHPLFPTFESARRAVQSHSYSETASSLELDLRNVEHVRRALSTIAESIDQIVYFAPFECSDGETVVDAGVLVLQPLLVIVKAIAELERRVAITIITSNAQRGRGEVSEFAQSGLWGIANVLRIEHPELPCRCIDLESTSHTAISQLLRELEIEPLDDRVILSGDERLCARLIQSKISSHSRLTFDPARTCLITGALGGIGRALIRWLLDHGARQLALISRSSVDPETRAWLNTLENSDVRISHHIADVTNIAQVESIIQVIKRDQAPLGSIFHLAGTVKDCMLSFTTKDHVRTVLSPKAQGALSLHRASSGIDLEHFVLFSSIVSTIGNAGQGPHAAANAVLDRIAEARRADGLPALSINWGAWSEVGVLAHDAGTRESTLRAGFLPLRNAHAFAGLEDALNNRVSRLAIAPIDWNRFLWPGALGQSPFFGSVSPHSPQKDLPRSQVLPTTLDELTRLVASRVVSVLGSSAGSVLDPSRNFFLAGMDSLTGTQLRNELQRALGIVLPTSAAFKHPTIEQLSSWLWEKRDTFTASRIESNVPIAQATLGSEPSISIQQRRWLRLLQNGYGRLLCPILFFCSFEKDVFQRAINSVVARHEILRWKFKGEEPTVLSIEEALGNMEERIIDLRSRSAESQTEILHSVASELRAHPPDPEIGPSWTFRVCILPDETFLFLLMVQHLEFDGTSISLFIDDLCRAYQAAAEGKAPFATSGPAPQYRDFVKWQNRYYQSDVLVDRAFFSGYYSHLGSIPALPGCSDTNFNVPRRSRRFTAEVSLGMWQDIQKAARAQGVSPFSVFAAAYSQFVGKILQKPEVVIGTIIGGRPAPEFQSMIGPFVAPYPIVTSPHLAKLALVQQIQEAVAGLNTRCGCHSADLTEETRVFHGRPIETYFSDIFIMFNNYRRESRDLTPRAEVLECLAPLEGSAFSALDAEWLYQIPGLFLIVDLYKTEIRFNFWYHEERFSEETLRDWAEQYQSMLIDFCSELASDDQEKIELAGHKG